MVTADGCVLLLERIPRRDSRKAVYLQHGILDSSMGWVSNGVVGSLAFAAFDQGYDVFLGIFVAWFLGNMLTREFLQESTGHTPSMNTGLGIYLHGLHVSEAIHVLKHELNLLRSTTRSTDQA